MSLIVNLAAASALLTGVVAATLISAAPSAAITGKAEAVVHAAQAPAFPKTACPSGAWPQVDAGCTTRTVRIIALTETVPATPQPVDQRAALQGKPDRAKASTSTRR